MRNRILMILSCLMSFSGFSQVTREKSIEAINIGNTIRVTGVANDLGSNSPVLVPTVQAVKMYADGIVVSGANVWQGLNITSYGAVPNATVVGSEDTARGADAAPSINQALANAADYQVIIIGYGDFVLHTKIDTIKNKTVRIILLGRLHCNKRDGFVFATPTTNVGLDRQHDFQCWGEMIGQENLPQHTKTTHDNGTGPNWAAMSTNGSAITVININKSHFMFNKVTGFANGICLRAGSASGIGMQENTFSFQHIFKCANGIGQYSISGVGYCDKNVFTGINGGIARIDAGLAWKIDGYAPTTYTGAFRANVSQNLLFERVDSVFQWDGDITETYLHFNIEGGASTGVFGTQVFKMRSIAPGQVRGTLFVGCEFFYANWFNTSAGASLGVNGKIVHTPLYTPTPGATLIGNDGIIDVNGNVVYEAVPTCNQTTRNLLSITVVKLIDQYGKRKDVTPVTASTYTAQVNDYYVEYNNNAGTFTLPPASTYPLRQIVVFNKNANILSVTGQDNISGNKSNTYFSDGSNWLALGDGAAGSSTNIYNTDGSLTGTRTLTQGSNILKFTGAAEVQKYGSLIRTSSVVSPVFGSVGLTLGSNLITGQVFSGSAWQSGPLSIGSTGNVTTMYGTVTLNDNALAISSGGTGLNTFGSAKQVLRTNSTATSLEYVSPSYELLYSNNTTIQISNSGANNTLLNGVGSLTPITLPSGSRYHFKSYGYISTTSGTQIAQFIITPGGSTGIAFTLPVSIPGSISFQPYTFDFEVSTNGTFFSASYTFTLINSGVPSVTCVSASNPTAWSVGGSNIDSKFGWGTASTSNILTVYGGYWEVFRLQ